MLWYLTSVIPALLQQYRRQRQEKSLGPGPASLVYVVVKLLNPAPKKWKETTDLRDCLLSFKGAMLCIHLHLYNIYIYIYCMYTVYAYTQQNNLNTHKKSFFPRVATNRLLVSFNKL